MTSNAWTLRDLYRATEMEGKKPLKDAQAGLDDAVASAYGSTSEVDALAFLLEPNRSCAEREAAGQTITGPGLPPSVKDPFAFISRDCVRMP